MPIVSTSDRREIGALHLGMDPSTSRPWKHQPTPVMAPSNSSYARQSSDPTNNPFSSRRLRDNLHSKFSSHYGQKDNPNTPPPKRQRLNPDLPGFAPARTTRLPPGASTPGPKKKSRLSKGTCDTERSVDKVVDLTVEDTGTPLPQAEKSDRESSPDPLQITTPDRDTGHSGSNTKVLQLNRLRFGAFAESYEIDPPQLKTPDRDTGHSGSKTKVLQLNKLRFGAFVDSHEIDPPQLKTPDRDTGHDGSNTKVLQLNKLHWLPTVDSDEIEPWDDDDHHSAVVTHRQHTPQLPLVSVPVPAPHVQTLVKNYEMQNPKTKRIDLNTKTRAMRGRPAPLAVKENKGASSKPSASKRPNVASSTATAPIEGNEGPSSRQNNTNGNNGQSIPVSVCYHNFRLLHDFNKTKNATYMLKWEPSKLVIASRLQGDRGYNTRHTIYLSGKLAIKLTDNNKSNAKSDFFMLVIDDDQDIWHLRFDENTAVKFTSLAQFIKKSCRPAWLDSNGVNTLWSTVVSQSSVPKESDVLSEEPVPGVPNVSGTNAFRKPIKRRRSESTSPQSPLLDLKPDLGVEGKFQSGRRSEPPRQQKLPFTSTSAPRRSARISEAVSTARPADLDKIVLVYPPAAVGAVNLTQGDLNRLEPEEFLNDSLIEFGLKFWLKELEERNPELAKDVYVFSSFFYKKINKKNHEEGYQSVRKWTSKVDLFSKKYIIVPINENVHWYLAIIYLPEHTLLDPPPPPPSQPPPSTRRRPRGSATAALSSSNSVTIMEDNSVSTTDFTTSASQRSSPVASTVDGGAAADEMEVEAELTALSKFDSSCSMRDEPSFPVTVSSTVVDPDQDAIIIDLRAGSDTPVEKDTLPVEESVSHCPARFRPSPMKKSTLYDSDMVEMDGVIATTTSGTIDIEDEASTPPISASVSTPALPTADPSNFYGKGKPRRSLPASSVPVEKSSSLSNNDYASDSQMEVEILDDKHIEGSDAIHEQVTWIFTLDSMGSAHKQAINVLKDYLKFEAKDKKGKDNPNEPKGKKMPVPLQPNYCDCGLYLLHFARKFVERPDYYHSLALSTGKKPSGSRKSGVEWHEAEVHGLRDSMKQKIMDLSKEWEKLKRETQDEAVPAPEQAEKREELDDEDIEVL